MGWRRTVAIAVASAMNACALVTNLDGLRGDAAVADAPTNDVANDVANDSPSDAPNDSPTDSPSDGAANSIAFVQKADGNWDAQGLSLQNSVVAGDALIVVAESAVPGAVTVTDTMSNSYQTIINPFTSFDGGTVSMFVAFNVKGGSTTVHVSASDAGPGNIYYAVEYRGITTFDGKATGNTQSTATDALVSSSISTSASPELLFAYADSLGTATPGTLFTSRSLFATNTIEDRIVMGPSNTYQANATVTDAGSIVFACFH